MAYIKRVELDGFKSFGVKHTTIEFTNTFTAIVGPNGCGKSNIVDGVNFVLGGLSAKSMRAEKLSDLIFSGGKGHSAAQKAYVSIVFDNSDNSFLEESKEINLTRLVDSKGNSKYLVNGKRLTRTKILDLLSSARIFPDGHNIVVQGDVADVIGMSPLERIEIIKEIAGVAEYEDKKQLSLHELENVEENISKIEWILNETKTRLDELQSQKNDLDLHRGYQQELEKCENALLSARIKELEESKAGFESEIEKSQKTINSLRLKIEKYNADIAAKEEEIESFEDDISVKGEDEWMSLGKEIEKDTFEVKGYHEQYKDLEHKILSSKNEIESRAREKNSLLSDIDSIKTNIESLESERVTLLEKIDQTQKNLQEVYDSSSKYTENLENKKTELKLISEQFKGISENYIMLKVETEKLSAQIKERQSYLSTFSDRKKKLDEKILSQKKKLEELLVKEEDYKQKRSQLLNRNDHLKRQLSEKSTLLKSQEDQLKTMYRKLDMEDVRRKSASYGGYDHAIKELISARDSGLISGIYGTVAQLGRVSKDYQEALQSAAGARLKYIIVSDDAVAKQCIEFLKSKKTGRASFIPLNKIVEKNLSISSKETIGRVGVIDFAINLVEFDSKFERAFKFVFSDTIVVSDLNVAKKIGIGTGVRMVTLSGDIVEKSGVMTGGHAKHSSIGFTEDSSTHLDEKIKIYEKENRELQRDIDLLKEELSMNSDNLSSLHLEIKTNTVEKDSLHETINRLSEELKEIDSGSRGSWNDVTNIEDELSAKLKTFTDVELEYLQLKSTKEELEKSIHEQTTHTDPKLLQYTQDIEKYRAALYEKESKLSSLRGRLQEGILPRVKEIDEKKIELTESISKWKEDILEIKSKIESVQKELAIKRQREEELRKELKQIRFRRAEIRSEIEKIRKKIEKTRTNISTAELEMKEFEIKYNDINDKILKLKEKLGQFPEISENVDEIKNKIRDLDAKILELTPKLNMRAYEEYQIHYEKKIELDQKLEQLLTEKNAILDYMNSIEAKKEEVFMTTFTQISKNFETIFAKLSPGGRGKLLLDTIEHPLEGGIDMQAQPAGKHIKRLASMSGGEKSIVAIAFIFSIQRYKPAPFYILDEIDAFLDDENVDRVAQLIRESSEKVQQIVITHRDVMMSHTSLLYGVSMVNGVSNVVSMKLDEAEELIKEAAV